MKTILCEHNPSPAKLEVLGVYDWPIWKRGAEEFPWVYDVQETCYLLSGKVIVTPEEGEPVTISRRDLVTFPAGLRCIWRILEPVEKHYTFD